MVIPAHTTSTTADWAALDQDAKRARILATADALFTESGIDVPMPDIADAIGIGVGSLYRQIGTKDDLIAELVLQRAAGIQAQWDDAAARDDAWVALQEAVLATVGHKLTDRVARETWSIMSQQREDVARATAAIVATMDRVVDAARAQGAVRDDITATDIRLLCRGAREAEALEPGGAARLARLALAGMVRA